MQGVRVERLDHLGIVAGICREIGLAEYLDGLAGLPQRGIAGLQPLHEHVVALLGASCENVYNVDE